ncbi:hypothetical protein EK21DRAFT_114230 [Setomelanomma holmii]|uniref:Uncharacterized protein n=1 Tax=Setomelanomma holmii TaxID=210430 RepID=A0A9P4H6J5_9PLEO|nr:hypothetical protein EK21DRAFT_114230 [Setomelanomma holmii]
MRVDSHTTIPSDTAPVSTQPDELTPPSGRGPHSAVPSESMQRLTLPKPVKLRDEFVEDKAQSKASSEARDKYKPIVAAAIPNLLSAIAKLAQDSDEDESAETTQRPRSPTPDWLIPKTPEGVKGKESISAKAPKARAHPSGSGEPEVTREALIANGPADVMKPWSPFHKTM